MSRSLVAVFHLQNQSLSLRDIIHIRSVIIKGKLNEAEYGPNLTLFLDLQDGKVGSLYMHVFNCQTFPTP